VWLSLFQPLLQWSILAMLPLRMMERKPRTLIGRSLAAGNGQFLAFDAAAYDRAGGHETVRSEVVEDVMIARAVKASGGKVALTPGPDIATCRMYEDNEQFVQGYTKSMWRAFGGPLGGLAVTAMFALEYLLPIAGLIAAEIGTALWWLCMSGVAAGVIGRLVAAGVAKDAKWPALLHPLSIMVFAWLMVESLRRKRRGRLQWRGRTLT
jgi:hypothetical protein